MYLFDTNVFLEILLGQANAVSAHKALSLMTNHDEGWITAFSLHSIEAILSNRKEYNVLGTFLEFVFDHPYLESHATTLQDERTISILAPKLKLDFDDALQCFVAKEMGLTLVTFDTHFRRVADLEIIFASEL